MTLIIVFLVPTGNVISDDLIQQDIDALIKSPDPYDSGTARFPAAIPVDDKEVKNKVKEFLAFQNESGGNVDFDITDSYGKTRYFQGRRRIFHAGWDIKAPKGTIIKWRNITTAVTGIKDNWPWRGNIDYSNLGYQTIVYTHNNNFKLKFCHLQNNDIWNNWLSGINLKKDQSIGKIGISGRPESNLTSSPHLHLEVSIKVGNEYKLTDPMAYFMIASCSCDTINCITEPNQFSIQTPTPNK